MCARNICTQWFLQKKNFISNKFKSSLELVFYSTDKVAIDISPDQFVTPDPFHPSLLTFCYLIPYPQLFNNSHLYCNFHKANYNLIFFFLGLFDWFSTISKFNINSVTNTHINTKVCPKGQ